MGHKTHPIGFRLGIVKDWQTHWFAPRGREYRTLVLEDMGIRQTIYSEYQGFSSAGISRIEIDRGTQDIVVNVHSARPGILIGRDGERVKRLRSKLEVVTNRKRIQLNVIEVNQPELNSYLVARNIADQIERRVSYRRALRQAAQRAMQAGAKGIKIGIKGRITGSEIARREKLRDGRVPLHTLRADIDYSIAVARTLMGTVGVKVWIYKGDVAPPPPEEVVEELETIEVTIPTEEPPEEKEDVTTEEGQVPENA